MLKQNRFNCNKVRVLFIYRIPSWNAVFLSIDWISHWFTGMSLSHLELGACRFVFWLLGDAFVKFIFLLCSISRPAGNGVHLLTWIVLWEVEAIWETKHIAVIIGTLDLWHKKNNNGTQFLIELPFIHHEKYYFRVAYNEFRRWLHYFLFKWKKNDSLYECEYRSF